MTLAPAQDPAYQHGSVPTTDQMVGGEPRNAELGRHFVDPARGIPSTGAAPSACPVAPRSSSRPSGGTASDIVEGGQADAVVSWISEPHTWTPPVGVKQARKRCVVAGWRPVAVVVRL